MLDAEDFIVEQCYHRGRLGRSLAYLHGAGSVAGLKAVVAGGGEEEIIAVTPGLAVDRLGRLIELAAPRCLRLGRWYEHERRNEPGKSMLSRSCRLFRRKLLTGPCLSCCPDPEERPDRYVVVADLFIRFVACERGKEPAFASGAFDALDAIAPSRLRDEAELSLVIRTEGDDDNPPPLPDNGFPGIIAMDQDEARQRALDFKLDDAWREGSYWSGVDDTLVPLPWHGTGQDGSELLIARLLIPVNRDDGFARLPALQVICDNYPRQFCFSTAELAWLAKITR
jgi:hypothetical protein